MLSSKGFYWFIICLLRHCCVLGFDCLFLCFVTSVYYLFKAPLFHYLFVTSVLCSRLRQRLLFCLLRHYAFSSCPWLLLFHYLFVTSVYYLFKVSIVSLSVCYVTTLF